MSPTANMQSNKQIFILRITLDQILYLTNCLYRPLVLDSPCMYTITRSSIMSASSCSGWTVKSLNQNMLSVYLRSTLTFWLFFFFPNMWTLLDQWHTLKFMNVPFLLCSICTQIIGLHVIATVDSFDVEMCCTNPLWRHFFRCMNRGNVNATHCFNFMSVSRRLLWSFNVNTLFLSHCHLSPFMSHPWYEIKQYFYFLFFFAQVSVQTDHMVIRAVVMNNAVNSGVEFNQSELRVKPGHYVCQSCWHRLIVLVRWCWIIDDLMTPSASFGPAFTVYPQLPVHKLPV